MVWAIGIIIIIVLFISGGLLGWIVRAVSYVFSILFEGWGNVLGCLIKIFVALFFLSVAIALL